MRVPGQLTIFFAMIMTLVLSLGLTLIEGARYSALRLAVSSVHQTVGNSLMSQYHKLAFNRYGILLFSVEEIETKTTEYMNDNFRKDAIGALLGVRDLLALKAVETQVEQVTLITDSDGMVMRRQCVQCMEERYGITYLEQIAQLLNIVEEQGLQNAENFGVEGIHWSQEELQEELRDVPLDTTYIPVTLSWLQKEALKYLVGGKTYSQAKLEREDTVSGRNLSKGCGINPELGFENTQWDQLLFIEYILQYTGNYRNPLKDGCLVYQLEYILNGNENDEVNLWHTADKLLQFRTSANIVAILANENRVSILKELSTSVSAMVGNPEIEPVIYGALLLIWAEVEGIYDVKLLLRGEGVNLLKKEEQWIVKVSWIAELLKSPLDEKGEGGDEIILPPLEREENIDSQSVGNDNIMNEHELKYEDYLRILLWFQDEQTTAMRFMDIMESDIRILTGQREFYLDNYADRVWIKTKLESGYQKEFWILRNYGY